MKLAKAREILHLQEKEIGLFANPDLKMALHLGIEALAFIELSRITAKDSTPALLHGETKE